jgi:PAS domain S-box-containing protein
MHQGRPHVLYIGRDISARKSEEELLRASEEQYRAIFNAAADALVLRDPDARIVDVNRAFLEISGFTRDEVLSDSRWIFALPEMSALAKDMHRRVIAGESVQFEIKARRKDGALIDIEMRAVPIRYRGRPHALGMARDITARKREEAERAELEAQLRQAQKMEAIGHLTGGIAHDFNNILQGILGNLTLAQEHVESQRDAKLDRYLERAHVSASRARELIQQMLTFSRGKRGAPRVLALPPLVAEAAQLLRPASSRRGSRRTWARYAPTRCSWSRCFSTCASTRATRWPGPARSPWPCARRPSAPACAPRAGRNSPDGLWSCRCATAGRASRPG